MALSCQGRYKPARLSPMPPRMKTSASYLRSLLVIYKGPTGQSNSTEGNGQIEQLPVADFWHQHRKKDGTKDGANGDINSSRVRPKSSAPVSTYSYTCRYIPDTRRVSFCLGPINQIAPNRKLNVCNIWYM